MHTFRLVNAEGRSTFVKFHWKPKLGLQSVVWNEAVKINGAETEQVAFCRTASRRRSPTPRRSTGSTRCTSRSKQSAARRDRAGQGHHHRPAGLLS